MTRACEFPVPIGVLDVKRCAGQREVREDKVRDDKETMWLPGSPVDARVITKLNSIWGFDRVTMFLAPLPSDPSHYLHHVVVLQEMPFDRDGLRDAPRSLSLEFVPWQGLRYQFSTAPPSKMYRQLDTDVCDPPIYSPRVVDVVEKWMSCAEGHYLDSVTFAQDLMHACRLDGPHIDHFSRIREQLHSWHAEVVRRERERRAAAISAVATGALFLCTVQ
eukprot:CAMPEP_0176248260 /NCGR_PEP_ID=MMETSP0121_2-20121125/33377_1 /TAXON_ID=160619 /ORGANISM="Kryptoperidinium foliaceum, Strain CCMP 1326" /LENGTH=218 /DNA_ID=CAMNT_0017587937 /DNA_START=51 /DNA_END=707 /DNA_ORIENTATION=-